MATKEKEVKVEAVESNGFDRAAMDKIAKHVGPWACTILYQVITGKNAFTQEPINAIDDLTDALLAKISTHGYKG